MSPTDQMRHGRPHQPDPLGQFAAGFVHDITNSLGAILNCSALLSRRLTDPATLHDVKTIQAAAQQALELTRALIAVLGQRPSHAEPVDLNDVVRGVAASSGHGINSAVQVHLDLAGDPLVSLVDRSQVEQIIEALTRNGCEAMPAGGELTISTQRSPDGDAAVIVRVKDSGHGMTPEVVRRAFVPFFTTKPRGSASGLGLALVDNLVQRNGGTVAIDSVVGEGTTVTLTLPAPATPTQAPDG